MSSPFEQWYVSSSGKRHPPLGMLPAFVFNEACDFCRVYGATVTFVYRNVELTATVRSTPEELQRAYAAERTCRLRPPQ